MPFQQYKLVLTHDQTRGIFSQYIYEPDNGDVLADMMAPGYFDASRYAPRIYTGKSNGKWYGANISVRYNNDTAMRVLTVSGPGVAATLVIVSDAESLGTEFLSKTADAAQTVVSDVTFDGDIDFNAGAQFDGDIDAGSFTTLGDVTGKDAVMSGNLIGEDATLRGNLAVVDVNLSGNVGAVDGTFSGDTSAVNATVSGTLTLPTGAVDGHVLTTDGAGLTSWADAAHVGASGADGLVQFAEGGAFSSSSDMSYNDSENRLNLINLTLKPSGLLEVGGVLSSDALEKNLTIRGPIETAGGFSLDFASTIGGDTAALDITDFGIAGVNGNPLKIPTGVKGSGESSSSVGPFTVHGTAIEATFGVPGNTKGVLDIRSESNTEFAESSITGFSKFNTDTALWKIGSTDPLNDHLVIEPYQANSWMVLKTGGEARITIKDPGDVVIDKQLEVGGRVTFLGGTRLGASGPRISQLIVTGTMPITQGDSGTIPTGLVDAAHVMSMDAFVTTAADEEVMPSNLTSGAGMSYTITALGTNVFIKTSSSNAGVVVGRPIRVLITYLVDA